MADTHDAARYLHIGAALLLPAIAVGIQYLSRRRTLVSALAVALLAIGVPQNIDRLGTTDGLFTGVDLFGPDTDEIMSAMANSELIDDVPRDTPLPTNLPWLEGRLTVGWLADIGAAGRLPRPDGLSPEIQLTADSLLALHHGGASPGLNCEPLARGRAVTLSASDEIRFAGTLLVTVTDGVHAFAAAPHGVAVARRSTGSGRPARRCRQAPLCGRRRSAGTGRTTSALSSRSRECQMNGGSGLA